MFEIKVTVDLSDRAIKMLTALVGKVEPAKGEESLMASMCKEALERATGVAEKAKAPTPPKKETVKEEAPVKEQEQTEETEGYPSVDDLKEVAVLAIRKDKEAVIKMKHFHYPDVARITGIREDQRQEAIDMLNEIIKG